jgi:diguanylate cyclase (GGDEF)-like protein
MDRRIKSLRARLLRDGTHTKSGERGSSSRRSSPIAGPEPHRSDLPAQALAPDGESPVARTLKSGFAFLRFPAPLEAAFLAEYRATFRRWVRISLIVACGTTTGFAVIDHWVLSGEQTTGSDLVRFGLQMPCVLIMLLATSERLYKRWYQLGIQIAAPLFGIGSVLLAMQSVPEHAPLVSSRMLLVCFFFYFMLGLSFYAALRSNLIMAAAFGAAGIAGAIQPEVATYQLFVLFCANIIGAAGAYALEHANRVAFLERSRLAEVAMQDGLTGLLNRAAFEEQIRRVWDHAVRERSSLAVVMIDIDHFKPFNDRYGHQAGDKCLRDVANAVRRTAHRRPLDFVARYGGEELVAVLFGCDRAHAQDVARSICEAVSGLRIPHIASTTQAYVTVSVGVATADPGSGLDGSHDRTLRLADSALYAAKEQGRDRHVLAERCEDIAIASEPLRDVG